MKASKCLSGISVNSLSCSRTAYEFRHFPPYVLAPKMRRGRCHDPRLGSSRVILVSVAFRSLFFFFLFLLLILPSPRRRHAHMISIEKLRQLWMMQQRQRIVECYGVAGAIEQDDPAVIA